MIFGTFPNQSIMWLDSINEAIMTLMMAHDNADCSSGKLTAHEVTMIINKH